MAFGRSITEIELDGVKSDIRHQVGSFDVAPSGKVSLLGCAVRQDSAGSGWYILDNTGHEPINMGGPLTVNGDGNLEIPYAVTYGKVGVVPVTVDETFAGLGIDAGGSVADNLIRISAYKTLDVAVNLQTGNITPSTFFSSRVTATNNSDGTITITHPSVGSNSIVPTLTTTGANEFYTHKVISYTSTTVVIGAYTPMRFRVRYDGSQWVITTPCKIKPTFVSFTDNKLTISYGQTIPTPYNIPNASLFKGSSGVGRVTVDSSSSTTQLVVSFWDTSNPSALIGTASTDMDFIVDIPVSILAETPLGHASISRPNCKLNLADVFSPDGNFWIGPGANIREGY